MRQMEPNNAGDSQASAGLQCWLRFKSLLPANWEREGGFLCLTADGFKRAIWDWAALSLGLRLPGLLVRPIRADGVPKHQPLLWANCAEPTC